MLPSATAVAPPPVHLAFDASPFTMRLAMSRRYEVEVMPFARLVTIVLRSANCAAWRPPATPLMLLATSETTFSMSA